MPRRMLKLHHLKPRAGLVAINQDISSLDYAVSAILFSQDFYTIAAIFFTFCQI